MTRGAAYTLSLVAINASNRPARLSGLTIANTDIQVSKDGAGFSNATNGASEKGSTGRYKVDLTAAEMDAKEVHVKVIKAGMDDVDVILMPEQYPTGSVVSDAGNTASTFKTDLASSTTDAYKDALVLFTSGALAEQVKKISGYNGSTKFITMAAAFTGTPANGDRFVIINR